jgi:hypothetical protein
VSFPPLVELQEHLSNTVFTAASATTSPSPSAHTPSSPPTSVPLSSTPATVFLTSPPPARPIFSSLRRAMVSRAIPWQIPRHVTDFLPTRSHYLLRARERALHRLRGLEQHSCHRQEDRRWRGYRRRGGEAGLPGLQGWQGWCCACPG